MGSEQDWDDVEPLAPSPPSRETVSLAIKETRAVYRLADAAYASFSCPASGECCQLSTTKRPPYLWISEWLVLEEHVRVHRGGVMPPARADGGCPFLDSSGKRCTVYADRPFGCRTFFCGRKRGPAHEPMEEVIRLSKRLEAVSRRVDEDARGPVPILDWIDSARAVSLGATTRPSPLGRR